MKSGKVQQKGNARKLFCIGGASGRLTQERRNESKERKQIESC